MLSAAYPRTRAFRVLLSGAAASLYLFKKKRHAGSAHPPVHASSIRPGCAPGGSASIAGPFHAGSVSRPCQPSLPSAAAHGRPPGFFQPDKKKTVHSAHDRLGWMAGYIKKSVWRRERDSNPWWAHTHNDFQDRRIRPLCHPSGKQRRIFCLC